MIKAGSWMVLHVRKNDLGAESWRLGSILTRGRKRVHMWEEEWRLGLGAGKWLLEGEQGGVRSCSCGPGEGSTYRGGRHL